MGVYLRDNMGCMTDFGYVILDTNLLMFMTIQACCNPSVEPSAHTRTHNRSSEAPARRRIGRFRSELVEITTAWKYVFMTFK